MHRTDIHSWQHEHIFDQDQERSGEPRTRVVVMVTAVMMVVEILFGITTGSMALLADGLHMASHACALGISLFAYSYARRHANDRRFAFGTGKVNALGGFTGAVLLAGFAIVMAAESFERFFVPVKIVYGQAIFVAVIGLIVNAVSAFILQAGDHDHGHDPHRDYDHDLQHEHESHHDHNLRAAYLHVLADALTSICAIGALFAAKYLSWVWMDPLMGIAGAVLVSRWSMGLLKTTAHVLLDRQGPQKLREEIIKSIESDGDSRVSDLHLWAIGPGIYSAIIAVVAHHGKKPEEYKKALPSNLGLAHVTVEILKCSQPC